MKPSVHFTDCIYVHSLKTWWLVGEQGVIISIHSDQLAQWFSNKQGQSQLSYTVHKTQTRKTLRSLARNNLSKDQALFIAGGDNKTILVSQDGFTWEPAGQLGIDPQRILHELDRRR